MAARWPRGGHEVAGGPGPCSRRLPRAPCLEYCSPSAAAHRKAVGLSPGMMEQSLEPLVTAVSAPLLPEALALGSGAVNPFSSVAYSGLAREAVRGRQGEDPGSGCPHLNGHCTPPGTQPRSPPASEVVLQNQRSLSE